MSMPCAYLSCDDPARRQLSPAATEPGISSLQRTPWHARVHSGRSTTPTSMACQDGSRAARRCVRHDKACGQLLAPDAGGIPALDLSVDG